MEILNKKLHNKPERKIKIMQFGEGNFLRAFVEWIIQDLNDKGAINAAVAVVQPMPNGRIANLAEQDGLYTLRLEGIDGGKKVKQSRIIDVIGDCINPFTDYEKYLKYGESEDLDVIISNTTESGIAVDKNDTDFLVLPVRMYKRNACACGQNVYADFRARKFERIVKLRPCVFLNADFAEIFHSYTSVINL